MNHALILQNISREGPGLIAQALEAKNISFQIADLSGGDPLPSLRGFDLLVVLGGPDSANDQTVKIQQELDLIRDWIHADKPYLGICLGLQLMVKAAGGKVLKAEMKETGFHDAEGNPHEIFLTPEGREDPLFHDLTSPLAVFQLHGETVELVPGMTLLARGKYCLNQVVRYKKNTYGIQCHIEVTQDLLEAWTREDADLLNLPRRPMLDHYAAVKDTYLATGLKFLSNFLDASLKARTAEAK